MVKIIDVDEKVIKKQYVQVMIDNEEYSIYICNDVVYSIYKLNKDGVYENTNTKALSRLTGYTQRGFKNLVDNFVEVV